MHADGLRPFETCQHAAAFGQSRIFPLLRPAVLHSLSPLVPAKACPRESGGGDPGLYSQAGLPLEPAPDLIGGGNERGFVNLRSKLYWRLREALDPVADDNVPLPPIARLAA